MGWIIGKQCYSQASVWIYSKHQHCKGIHKAWLCSTALLSSFPWDTVIINSSYFFHTVIVPKSRPQNCTRLLYVLYKQRTKSQFESISSEVFKVSALQLQVLCCQWYHQLTNLSLGQHSWGIQWVTAHVWVFLGSLGKVGWRHHRRNLMFALKM